MHRARRLRLGLLVALALVGLVLGLGGATPPKPPHQAADDGVMFPPDRAVLLSGSFDVIYKGDKPALKVDGEPYQWETFQAPVHVAHVRLAPGVHDLEIGNRRRQFVVALNEQEHDGPADWPIHRFHGMEPDGDRCADCHQTSQKDGRTAVGELRSYEACFACHPSVEFEAVHSHPLEPIEHCQMCHALHGSSRKSLLKAPVKQLCLDCHDA